MNKKMIGFVAALVLVMSINIIASAQPTSMPHVVFGTVNDANGTAISNVQVRITNLRTDEYLTDTTNDQGTYQIDMANFPSDYLIGDEIEILAEKGELSGTQEILISSGPNDQCNMVIEETDEVIEEIDETPFPGIFPIMVLMAGMAVSVGLLRKRR